MGEGREVGGGGKREEREVGCVRGNRGVRGDRGGDGT